LESYARRTPADAPASAAGRVGVRLTPVHPFNSMGDSDPQGTFEFVAFALSARGLAYLHVVETGDTAFDWALRRTYKGVYMANGGYDRGRAIDALARGHADLVSFALLYIANPDLVERFRANAALSLAHRPTFYAATRAAIPITRG
jgi:N-ethylmaleimide reductase